MRHAIFASVVVFGLAVPAIASAGTSSDPVAESFERDLNREAVSTAATDRAMDAFQYAVNSTLRSGSDRLVASFERDLNRQSVETSASRHEPDPVQYLVNNMLGGGSDPVVASFERDLSRGSTLTALSESVFGVDSPEAIDTALVSVTV